MGNGSGIIYEEFYYKKEDRNLPIEILEDEYDRMGDMISEYKMGIFCPECHKARLKFCPQTGSHREGSINLS